MSARPRPVTATIRRPASQVSYRPVSQAPVRSDSSTESLVSGVDSRYIKCTSDDSCSHSGEGEGSPMSEKNINNSNNANRIAATDSESLGRFDSESASPKISGGQLSAWESWVLRKAKQERQALKLKLQEQVAPLLQECARENEHAAVSKQQEKLSRIELVLQDWQAKKDAERRRQESRQKAAHARQEATERAKKEKISELAAARYKEWLKRKQELLKVEQDAEKERQRVETLQLEDKRRLGQEAFSKWEEEAARRPRPPPHSYGYTCGALTGYYDAGAYPQPAFRNPVPWQPVCTMTSEKTKPAIKRKAKRNPWGTEN